jgi:hypothetical protein
VGAAACTSLLTASDHLSGYVVIAGGLPPSAYTPGAAVQSFSFTDGVDTISSTDNGAVLQQAAFTTNAAGQIISGFVYLQEVHNNPTQFGGNYSYCVINFLIEWSFGNMGIVREHGQSRGR